MSKHSELNSYIARLQQGCGWERGCAVQQSLPAPRSSSQSHWCCRSISLRFRSMALRPRDWPSSALSAQSRYLELRSR